ncbi:MAG: hypothetical protein EAZ60_20090 [Oscillatoriales cyanobacterium]|nr:MAG: hypothetical protein EAZ60_20090 [Oscillatoriales cyanobacterium]
MTTQKANQAPVVTASNQTVNAGASITPIFSVTDADGDRISHYYFSDLNSSSTSGYFTLNGTRQNGPFTILAEQLSNVRFVGGSVAGTDSVSIDGKVWAGKVVTMTTQKVNQAPVVTASNQTVNVGASITPNFSVTDADGDRISLYYFYDQNTSSTSGYFTVNGVQQTSGFSVTPEQLSTVRFVGGSVAGTDSVTIYASDGQTWGSQAVTMTTKANQAPVVTASNQTVNVGASITPNFSVTDADGDRISLYYFYDSNTSSTSGYFTVNGVQQSSAFSVTPEQLSTVRFVGGSVSGTDSVTIYASDGQTWGSQAVTMTTKANQAPVVTATNQTVNAGASIVPNFSVTDADGDRISLYYFLDSNTSSTSGYFTLNGVQQSSAFSVTPEQLSTVRFVGGSVAGTDSVTIYAYDGQTWGSQAVTMTTKANQIPFVTVSDQTVRRSQTIQPSFGVTDADGDKITRYAFYDNNNSSTSGYFTVNGAAQAAEQTFYVDADKLSTVRFVGGSTAGSDYVYARAYDGTDWSNWNGYTIQTQAGSTPTVSASDQTVTANESIKLSLSATDADGDKITSYKFYDANTSSTSGYFTVNGAAQAAGQTFYVDADKLDTVRFVGGTAVGADAVYVAAADGVDGWGAWKPFNVSTSAAADWFEKNIKDLAIRSLARSRFQDGWLDRQDMIDIFRDAKDGGVVDANEFADLQALTKNTDFIKMPDHVRVLSAKIAEGNPANNSYQGSYLGNLYAGSSDNQLEKLIQEHFFGGDRPLPLGEYSYGSASNVVYRYAEGNLFLNGVSYEDVRQGSVGDCYYLASLASVALKTPDAIREMFIDNGDGTYTVRFFNKGKADYVTVDRYLPVNSDGTLPFAKVGKGKKYDDSTNELWVALAEKAYAQMNEASWLGRLLLVPGTTDQYVNLNGLNSYKGIENGWSGYSTDHISNKKGTADWIQSSTPNTVVDAFNYGKTIIFSSKDFDSTKLSNVVDNHAYTMVGYNQATGLFKLFNPWGVEGELYWSDFTFKPGIIELTWNQIQRYFSQWTVNG